MASSPPFFEALVSKPVAAPLPPMPALPITSARTILNMKTLPVAAGDIFICSYPKSGTTWTQNIVYQLVTRGAPLAHISEYVPFFESDRTWADDDARGGGGGGPTVAEPYRSNFEAVGRRMFNTHCRWEMMPRGDGAKYVYLVRDGRDALVSFYHHLTHQARESSLSGALPSAPPVSLSQRSAPLPPPSPPRVFPRRAAFGRSSSRTAASRGRSTRSRARGSTAKSRSARFRAARLPLSTPSPPRARRAGSRMTRSAPPFFRPLSFLQARGPTTSRRGSARPAAAWATARGTMRACCSFATRT